MKKTNKCIFKIIKLLFYTIIGIVFLGSTIITRLTEWFSQSFSISIPEILFTIKSPLQGADTDFLKNAVKYCNIGVLIFQVIFYLGTVLIFECIFSKIRVYLGICRKKNNKKILSINLYVIYIVCICIIISICAIKSIKFADSKVHFFDFLKMQKASTKIYEEKYVNPVNIQVRGKRRNLIYIYVESLETTYASVDEGGIQEINYIPNLTKIAKQYVNFSVNDSFGGFPSCFGSTWTMGALFSSSTGVPFAFPVHGNSMNLHTSFANGITAMGDILSSKGYVQEFLCGSDGNFAGRKQFYEQHGNYRVFDLFTAREKGYIPDDYYVWWGFEDEILYRIAKDELLQLAKEDKPFNFTMLTVDTHHEGGYKCKLCGDKYSENLANVVACADKQIYEFINWIKEQDFYENTTIVIMGDHPRMDSILINNTPYTERYVYNCFINSNKTIKKSEKNRNFTTTDMFPTILSAMGFEIEGDRLGLGTDLFSETPTLSEEMGFEEFSTELSKYSQFYIDNFS